MAQVLKASVCLALLGPTALFSQAPAAKAHAPSAEERKILAAAGVSPEFNSSDGPSLLVCLMQSKVCTAGSFGEQVASPVAGSREPSDWIRPAACAADLVALGRVVGQTSALSANEATVITLYNFKIQALYKAKDKHLIGGTVSVLRRAGTLSVAKGVIRQEDPAVPPLAIGTNYILLLRQLAGTRGYVSATGDLDFETVFTSETEARLGSLKGSWRRHIAFDSLSKFEASLEKALGACGATQ
jgi:hypothetical protein